MAGLKTFQSLFIFLIGMMVTSTICYFIYQNHEQEKNLRFQTEMTEITRRIQNRFDHYEGALIQTRAFILSSDDVTPEEFHDYFENTQIFRRYPGIQGLGYVVKLRPTEVTPFTKSVRKSVPNYKVWPDYPREYFFPVRYLEPQDWRNRRALGYDMFSESIRREAMERARDSGEASLCGKVVLVQESDKSENPGFNFFLPLYDPSKPQTTVEERRKALIGFVYSPFRAEELFDAIFSDNTYEIAFSIYDSADTDDKHRLYSRRLNEVSIKDLEGKRQIRMGGRIYTLSFKSLAGFENQNWKASFALAIMLGLLITYLLLWIFLINRREIENSARAKEAIENERAKYAEAFDKSPAAIAILSGKEHIFEMTNPAFRELIGGRDVVGKTVREALPELDNQPFFDLLDSVIRTGHPVSMKDTPIQLLDKDGKLTERFVDLVYQRIDTGNGYGIFVQAVETTSKVIARRKIEDSEAKLQMFMESMPQMAFIAAANGDIVYYNRRHYDYFGVERNVHEGWGWRDVHPTVHPDDLDRTVAIWKHSIETGKMYEIEYRLRRHDGAYRWHLGRAIPVRNNAGEIIQWFGTNTEVHEQKDLIEKLQASEARLKIALEAGEMGTWIINLPSNAVHFSDESLRLFGIQDHDTNVDLIIENVIHPEDRMKARNDLEKSLREKGVYYSEYRIIRQSDKVERWILATGQVKSDETGKVKIFSGVIMDITDRKLAEEKIAEKSAFLETVLEQMPVASFFAEAPSGKLLFTNKKFHDVWKKSPGDTQGIEGFRLYKGFHADGTPYEPYDWPLARALTKGDVTTSEDIDVELFDGTRAVMRLSAAPIRNSKGQIIAGVVLSEDVTEKIAIQRELQDAIIARDEFLSIASHELKTPLTSLGLNTQVFLRAMKRNDQSIYTPEKVHSLVNLVARQIGRLTRLIDDMLDVSRIRSGKLVIEKDELDACDLVDDVIERLKAQFLAANLQTPNFKRCENTHAKWDRFRIEQVMVNLLTNAIRYGNGKPVEVEIKPHGDMIRISVRDNGIGISEDAKEKIFNRFERSVNANEVSGLGLGLFISKQIVEAHKGKIWVESEIGAGSTFHVDLPKNPDQFGGEQHV